MPLARFALYESGVEIYIASTADDGDAWQPTLVHIARESRAFVVSPSHFQRAAAYPDDFPLRRLLEGAGHDRPRRLGDPRARRRLPRRAALRRGGHPLRRARPGGPLGRAAAVRPGGPLPPARRARRSRSPRSSREQRRRRRRRRLRRLDRARARPSRLGRDARRAVRARQRALGLGRRHPPPALLARRPGVVHAARRAAALELWRELEARDRADGSSSRSASRGSTAARRLHRPAARQTLERLGIPASG